MSRRVFCEAISAPSATAVFSIRAPPTLLDVNLDPSKFMVLIEGQEILYRSMETRMREHYQLDKENDKPEREGTQEEVDQVAEEPSLVQVLEIARKKAAAVAATGGRQSAYEHRKEPLPEIIKDIDGLHREYEETHRQDHQESSVSDVETVAAAGLDASGDAGSHSRLNVSWPRQDLSDTVLRQAKLNTWATGKAMATGKSAVPISPVTLLGKGNNFMRDVAGAGKCNLQSLLFGMQMYIWTICRRREAKNIGCGRTTYEASQDRAQRERVQAGGVPTEDGEEEEGRW